MELPNETGYFLWYILDLGYLNVGAVHISEDTEEHLAYLTSITDAERAKRFYVYPIGTVGRKLTMYHDAHDHLPPLDGLNRPLVDGWIPFDFRTIGLIKEPPLKLI